MHHEMTHFPIHFLWKGQKKCPIWAVTFIMYDKTMKLKVLHLSLTLFVGLNVTISLCKF